MALQVSSAGFPIVVHRRRGGGGGGGAFGARAVSSESITTVKGGEEDKVKLGGSDVKVTRLGLGAWSWGDTSYWNDSGWDGMCFDSHVLCTFSFVFLTLTRV